MLKTTRGDFDEMRNHGRVISRSDTEIKITLPYWLMWCLIGVIAFQGAMDALLYQQRYNNDMEFMAKVKEIQKENADLRSALGR